jgi:adenylylsulfate kinase
MKPVVIWLTGLSGAGKTTISSALLDILKKKNLNVDVLDGDEVRSKITRVYGFSIEERKKFVNEVVYMARNMLEFQNVDVVIVSLISPLRSMRDNARDILTKYSNAKFVEIFLDIPLEVCEERDVKGLYKKVRAGEIKEFTGIDSPYEPPLNPEILIPYVVQKEKTVEEIALSVYNAIYDQENTTTN